MQLLYLKNSQSNKKLYSVPSADLEINGNANTHTHTHTETHKQTHTHTHTHRGSKKRCGKEVSLYKGSANL